MVRRRLARGIARQIDIRAVVHARAATRNYHAPAPHVAPFQAPLDLPRRPRRQQLRQRHDEEVVRGGVDGERGGPVRVRVRPQAGLQRGQVGRQHVAGLARVAADAGVGDEDVEVREGERGGQVGCQRGDGGFGGEVGGEAREGFSWGWVEGGRGEEG